MERCLSRWRPAIGCPSSACSLSGLTGAVVSRETRQGRHLDGEIVSKCGRVGWRLGSGYLPPQCEQQPTFLLSFFPSLRARAFFIFVRSSPLNGFPSWFVRSPSFHLAPSSIFPPISGMVRAPPLCLRNVFPPLPSVYHGGTSHQPSGHH